jgi:hypothetical protein
MNTKLDFKKTLKYLYNPSISGFHIVDVPAMNYLSLDGQGDPNTSQEYQRAVESLYAISYAIKFSLKAQGFDYTIPPLEGLWWMEDMNQFTLANKDSWEWTMMIMQPEWVTSEWAEKTTGEVYRKKKLSLIRNVRFNSYDEGLSVQILYTGAYQNEAPTIAKLHEFIKTNGYQTNGKHHEIYLSDIRRTSPEKLKTILRQPIRK